MASNTPASPRTASGQRRRAAGTSCASHLSVIPTRKAKPASAPAAVSRRRKTEKGAPPEGHCSTSQTLSWLQVENYDRYYIETFAENRARAEQYGISPKQSQIDNIYTESFVAHLIPELIGGDAWRGGLADLSVYLRAERKKGEVKATGKCGFQELKAKDVAADYLIWMHFGDRYETGAGEILIYVLENPAGKISAGKLMLTKLAAVDGVRCWSFSFETGILHPLERAAVAA